MKRKKENRLIYSLLASLILFLVVSIAFFQSFNRSVLSLFNPYGQLAQVGGSSSIHVSPSGDDANDGSSSSPVATMERALALFNAQSSAGEIIVHGGVYNLTRSIQIRPNSGNTASLTIKAGSGGNPVFDGSKVVTPTPLEGQEGIYLITATYSGSNLPQIWEAGIRARYSAVPSLDILKQTDYGAYPYAANTIAIRSRNGTAPRSGDLYVSLVDSGFQITRSNVTVQGITFKNFGRNLSSAGIFIGSSSFGSNIDNVSIVDSYFENSFSGIYTYKGTNIQDVEIRRCHIRDVASGINAHGGNVTIEHCDMVNDESPSNLFAFRNPDQYTGATGIMVRDNYGLKGSTYRYNLIKGFRKGIDLNSTLNTENGGGFGVFIIEHNTITNDPNAYLTEGSIGISFARYVGADCTNCGPERALFRYNIIDGFKAPYNFNKSGLAMATKATLDKNVFWNSRQDLGSYAEVPQYSIGSNVVADPLFVNAQSRDYKVYANSPAVGLDPNGSPAGAFGSVSSQSPGGVTPPPPETEIPPVGYQIQKLYDRANQNGFVVFSNDQTVNQYISYRKKGTTTWIKGFDTSAYQTLSYDDLKGLGEKPMAVVDLEPNTAYEYKIVPASGDPSPVYEIRTEGSAKIYYISTSGTDSRTGGSASSPFRTLQYALDMVLPGDTIILKAGVYNGPSILFHGGTAGAPITIKGESYGSVTLSGQGTASMVLSLNNLANIKLSDLYFQFVSKAGLRCMSCQNVEIANNIFSNGPVGSRNLSADAILIRDGGGINVHNNLIMNWWKGIAFNNSPSIRIRNNTIVNIAESGIEAGYGSASASVADTEIMHNTINFFFNTAMKVHVKSAEMSQLRINYNNYGTVLVPSYRGTPDSEDIFVKTYSYFSNSRELLFLNRIGVGSKTYVSFKEWKAETGYDANSIFADPMWVDPIAVNFSLRSGSPNLLGSGLFIGAFGQSGTTPEAVNGLCGTSRNTCSSGNLSDQAETSSSYTWRCLGSNGGTNASCSIPKEVSSSKILYVSNSGSDSSGDGTSAKPFKTIQKAIDTATAGTKVMVKAGRYPEKIVSRVSGTASNPIIIEGEVGPGGEKLVTIEGGTVINNWQPAPEIGSGVYKASFGEMARAVSIDGKYLDKIKDIPDSINNPPNMKDGTWRAYFTSDLNFEATPDNLEHIRNSGGNPDTARKIKFWDVTYGMFGYLDGVVYVRLKDKSSPNNYVTRVAGNETSVIFYDGSYVTMRNFKIEGAWSGIAMSGSGVHHITIENNYINTTNNNVAIISGASNNIVRNNEITRKRHGGPSGAWNGVSDNPSVQYDLDLKQAFYQWDHHWIFNSGSGLRGVNIGGAAEYNEIYGNKIHGLLLGISNSGAKNIKIYNNEISNISSVGLLMYPGSVDIEIYGNVFRNNNINIRNHQLSEPLPRKYHIYNNWFIGPPATGAHIFFHWFTGSSNPPTPQIYIYHNNFVGGKNAINFDSYASEYNGVPGVHVLNNIFSTSYDLVGASLPESNFFGSFDYNSFDTIANTYKTRNWFGSHNKINTNVPFFNLNVSPGTKVPSGSPARAAGIDLSRSQTINGKTVGPLPGVSSCPSGPSMGVFDCPGGPPIPTTNQAPSVSAGQDQTIEWPTKTVSLYGYATDDGLPSGSSLAITWSKVSGPGTVTFSPANERQTTATFSAQGTYVIKLTGSDGTLTSTDDLTVTISADRTAPERSLGSPQGTLEAGTTQATLSVTTNEQATCKYDTSSNRNYTTMTGSLTASTNGLTHTATLSNLTSGAKSYYIRCRDQAGNENTTNYPILFSIATVVTPTVDTEPPVVSIASPSNGDSRLEGTITLEASASDNVGVTKVEFRVNNTLVGTNTSGRYAVNWSATPGTYTLTAKAYDQADNSTVSDSVTFTVRPQPDSVEPPPPPQEDPYYPPPVTQTIYPSPQFTPTYTIPSYVPTVFSPQTTIVTTPATITANISMSRGSTGPEVTLLQKVLVRERLLTPEQVTGTYGQATEDAVKAFQKRYNIVMENDSSFGKVDARTIAVYLMLSAWYLLQ